MMPKPAGTCDHDGMEGVSGPVLVKLNWRGSDFKAGSWGKDSALGTKLQNHYWVFPANKGSHILETFRLYASYKKMMLYFPIMEFSLKGNQDKCENCGQGSGVIFYNGSFYYNCLDSRALCKTDPNTMHLLRKDLEDEDPASFNNVFSYKGVKYQDMDLGGDEKGLWMVHGTNKGNGNMVVRKIDPNTLQVETPWITTQKKTTVTNSFMICGVLYATKRVNATHENIFYAFDTNKIQEFKTNIFLEKSLPTVQSLQYNPNDQKLYMYNDGYLVYYDVTFKNPGHRASRAGEVVTMEQIENSSNEGRQVDPVAVIKENYQSSASDQQQHLKSQGESNTSSEEGPSGIRKEEDPSSADDQQQHLTSNEESSDNHEEGQIAVSKGGQNTMREGDQVNVRDGVQSVVSKEGQPDTVSNTSHAEVSGDK
ncbi:olfactomedin-like [Hemicordylus capensis]|uniref:olfactomedin-like n=1 Tax=Hemicordylus capensis TaxID=884348 RepID=UPI00230241D7|nr:olfactomedin-like [Hemicordylus capensis]